MCEELDKRCYIPFPYSRKATSSGYHRFQMYLSNKYKQQTDEDNSGETGSRFQRVRDIYRLGLRSLRDALNGKTKNNALEVKSSAVS